MDLALYNNNTPETRSCLPSIFKVSEQITTMSGLLSAGLPGSGHESFITQISAIVLEEKKKHLEIQASEKNPIAALLF